MLPLAGLFMTLSASAAVPAFHIKEGLAGDASIGADTVTEITWADSRGLPRTVELVTAGSKYNPGWLARYRYDDPPIVCNAVDSSSGGLCDVSHGGGLQKSRGRGEWSSRNHRLAWIVRGAHHGLVRLEYDMPFSLDDKSKQVSTELIHVTRDLFFADGLDQVVYAITLDFSRVPKDKASVDTRSPYMRWDWDGSGGGMGPYTGFRSGTNGTLVCEHTATSTGRVVKTLNDNTVPYNYQWNDASRRCVAIIGTRPYAELPQGSECWAGSADPILPAGTWERDQVEAWKLPYQVGAYSGWIEKLSWQVPYQLGHEKVVDGPYTYSAWPAYSYATQVVLDRLEHGSFERLLAEQVAMPGVKATAAVGTVAATAPAGPGRDTEQVPLVTPGYDPLLRAWRFTCAGDHADVTLATGAASLEHPLLVFDGFHGGRAPVIGDALVSLDRVHARLYVTAMASRSPGRVSVAF